MLVFTLWLAVVRLLRFLLMLQGQPPLELRLWVCFSCQGATCKSDLVNVSLKWVIEYKAGRVFDTDQCSSSLLISQLYTVQRNKLKWDWSPCGAAVTTRRRFGCVVIVEFSWGRVQRLDCLDTAAWQKLTLFALSCSGSISLTWAISLWCAGILAFSTSSTTVSTWSL